MKTRNKSPFIAYDLNAQKIGWQGTRRTVEFGTQAMTTEMTAMQNLEGALWVMETSTQLRTFAYSSSPKLNGTGNWQLLSWSNIGMWQNGPAPQSDIFAVFVDTKTGARCTADIDIVVNRSKSIKMVNNTIQLVTANGHQFLSNEFCTRWYYLPQKQRARRNDEDVQYYDAVYLFWKRNSNGIQTLNALI